MTYSVVIRTLGRAGAKYAAELAAIGAQTVQPQEVFVVLPPDYDLPPERLGRETFLRCPKGMLTQRTQGLCMAEAQSEADVFLALDDDIAFAPDYAERCLAEIERVDADMLSSQVVQPQQVVPAAGGMKASVDDFVNRVLCIRRRSRSCQYAERLTRAAGSEEGTKKQGIVPTQFASGTAIWVRRGWMPRMRYEDERWVEQTRYAYPDDVVIAYKMCLAGARHFRALDIEHQHLDAGSSDARRQADSYYAVGRNVLILWHRFVWPQYHSALALAAITWRTAAQGAYELLRAAARRDTSRLQAYMKGVRDALQYLKSEEYKALPPARLNSSISK